MPLRFDSPHCRDVIEIRNREGRTIGAIRLEKGTFRLFQLVDNQLRFVALFGSLGEAKNMALDLWEEPKSRTGSPT